VLPGQVGAGGHRFAIHGENGGMPADGPSNRGRRAQNPRAMLAAWPIS
jgi:hypothetical protein